MKHLALAILLAAGLPVAAAAQQGPPTGMGAGSPMMRHHMSDADRAKMMQMHTQARTAILNALSPAHKALLQSVAGALAVAATPDGAAAAAKLDAALTPAEKKAILDTANSMHSQMQAMMPSPPPGMSPRPEKMRSMPSDPGQILLMMAAMNMMGDDGMKHAMPQ